MTGDDTLRVVTYTDPRHEIFASCYRCGEHCLPSRSLALSVRQRIVREFAAVHACEPLTVPAGAHHGRCRMGNPTNRDRLCTGVAISERGWCEMHDREARTHD